jgi:hypothetical protein
MCKNPSGELHPLSRQLLAGCLGLGAGIAERAESGPFYDSLLTARFPPLSDNERSLSRTDRLDLVGLPQSRSMIRQNSRPFAPERIAVLPSCDSLRYEKIWGSELRRRIDGRIRAIRDLEGYDLKPSNSSSMASHPAAFHLLSWMRPSQPLARRETPAGARSARFMQK